MVNTTGADFVFDKKYMLPKLSDVKAYIGKNHHLPDMPSEQDVKDNGINLGEMIKVQTKKIEELTLYLIEKDKQLTEQNIKLIEQNNQIVQQQKKADEQYALIEALEKTLLKITSSK